MLRSTFLGYRTASSALRVNQNLLDVVGQNMSNVNTEGYSRQRLDINSVSFRTNNLQFGIDGAIIGQGVEATGISQYRDRFLDLRYRAEAAKSGTEYIQSDALGDLEGVFDEISKKKMDAQFSELANKLQELTKSPSDPVMEGVVRTSASMLCQMFNDYSKKINTITEQQKDYLKSGAIVEVNQLMKNIADLNKQIREDNISGNPSLELTDKRNMFIDKLSSALDIDVKVTKVPIGDGKTIDELSINLKGNNMKLVDDDEFVELGVTSSGTGINLIKNLDGTTPSPLTDLTNVIDKGEIAGYLKFLNGKGELATGTEEKFRGVQYYEKMLDSLANKFAFLLNEANSTTTTSKPMFESRVLGDDITAGNIKIADKWLNESGSYITNTKTSSGTDNTGAPDNILKMISIFQSKHEFLCKDTNGVSKSLFKGKMQEFFSYTVTNLNLQVQDAQNSYDIYSETQNQIDLARKSLSSVDLNEEGVNLLTYSKSYNAAARLMTTLDEMLDTLINRMAV